MVLVSTSACSAQVPPSIMELIWSVMPGSWARMMWPAMISASATPTVSFMWSACCCVRSQKTLSAAW